MQLRSTRFALQLVALITGAFPAVTEAQTLTKAIEIRSLSVSRAQEGIPAKIRGVVVFIEPASVFVQDETSTAFFRPAQGIDSLRPGDEIEVQGLTRMGLFLPGIGPAEFRVLRQGGPRPAGIPATYDDLVSARFHYQRVAVEGVVRSLVQIQENRSSVRLAMGSRVIEVRVESPPDRERVPIDSRVRIQGLAAGFANDRRQVVQTFVQVIDWQDVTIVEPAPPAEKAPLISADELRAFNISGHGERRVRIEGTVTAVFPQGQTFLRKDDMAFDVRLRPASASLKPGDRIEVIGFPEMDRFSASVVDAELLQRGSGPALNPVDVDSPDQLDGVHDAELVAVTAILGDAFKTDAGTVLRLQGKKRTIQARLAEAIDPVPGSKVRVVGICLIESQAGAAGFFKSRPGPISISLRSADDLIVLQKPPWWTARRLGMMLAALAGVTLVAGLWIAVLRRQVTRQTAALRHKIESEAALEERQRIAREFHDTLEQELAGVSLRLDALATRALDEKGRSLITASRSLVSRIQSETRDLISDLRDPSETSGDLIAALSGIAARQSGDSGIDVQLAAAAAVPPLPAGTVHDLRMMARESVNNALKHGMPTRIGITLLRNEAQLVLTISDNGCGFDVDAATGKKRGHFGCAGIRERARKLGASVVWRSTRDEGTTVEIILPLTGTERLSEIQRAPQDRIYQEKPAAI